MSIIRQNCRREVAMLKKITVLDDWEKVVDDQLQSRLEKQAFQEENSSKKNGINAL